MNGPDHYVEAENLLMQAHATYDTAMRIGSSAQEAMVIRNQLLAESQVHATLALVAATAVPAARHRSDQDDLWTNAIVNERKGS